MNFSTPMVRTSSSWNDVRPPFFKQGLAQIQPYSKIHKFANTVRSARENKMTPSCRLEALESRQLMSVAAPVLVEAQPLPQPALTAMATHPKLVANTYFLGSPTLGGISGKLALKIKTISGTAVTATLYSTDWGGFTIAVTGAINSAGAISLTGKNSTTRVTAFKGTLSSTSKVISGSCTIVQMGITLKGTISETRSSTAPVLKTYKYPSLLGKYSGTLSDGNHPTLSITKQTGGLFWGTTSGGSAPSALTGFQSSPGVFQIIGVESSGYTIITGTRRSNGSLSASAIWYGNDGSKEAQTGVFKKV